MNSAGSRSSGGRCVSAVPVVTRVGAHCRAGYALPRMRSRSAAAWSCRTMRTCTSRLRVSCRMVNRSRDGALAQPARLRLPAERRHGGDQVSDIKLFRLDPAGITELPGEAVQVEK